MNQFHYYTGFTVRQKKHDFYYSSKLTLLVFITSQQTIDSPLTAHNAKITQGLEFYPTRVPTLPRGFVTYRMVFHFVYILVFKHSTMISYIIFIVSTENWTSAGIKFYIGHDLILLNMNNISTRKVEHVKYIILCLFFE